MHYVSWTRQRLVCMKHSQQRTLKKDRALTRVQTSKHISEDTCWLLSKEPKVSFDKPGLVNTLAESKATGRTGTTSLNASNFRSGGLQC